MVVSPLTSEAIVGIDLLQTQQAVIDLGQGQLCLKNSGCNISLDTPPPTPRPSNIQQVRMVDTVEIPPRTIMELPAHCESLVEGVCLVKEAVSKRKHQEESVAHAMVQPTSLTIPVCILNASDEPVTLYAGSIIS